LSPAEPEAPHGGLDGWREVRLEVLHGPMRWDKAFADPGHVLVKPLRRGSRLRQWMHAA